MSDDHDLRSRLERIASSAGDPPEHGLERVAARRHRRLRRRRGAVATAAVLAVLAAGAPLISRRLDDERSSVTASGASQPVGAPPEVPRELEVRCEASGIGVRVASVRPQVDGLHIRVVNLLPEETTLQVVGDGWDSGPIKVRPGDRNIHQPVPPGEVTVGCQIGGAMQRRVVDLVDPAGYYQEPQLDCDEGDIVELSALPVDPPDRNTILAARSALDPHLVDGTEDDQIRALRGYPSQTLGVDTLDPVVQLIRDGETIAFAHVRGVDDQPDGPWVTVHAEVCRDMIVTSATDSTTSSSAPPQQPAGTPA